MSTTVTSKKAVASKHGVGGGPGFPGPNGNGSKGNGWHGRQDDDAKREIPLTAYRILMWIILGAVVTMFVALSGAYIALSGNSEWTPIRMPRMFFLSTGIILLSSVTMSHSHRSLKKGEERRYVRYLAATLLLGVAFLGSQFLGWRQLVAQGVYLSGRPHSSFFYLFTAVHAAHLVGGIFALSYLLGKARDFWIKTEKRVAITETVSLYWHFMDGLWVWLFLLLLFWR